MSVTSRTRTAKGVSLARGPALILGTILLVAGLYLLYKQHVFPKFSQFPNGKPVGHPVFLGVFGANGWTGMLTAAAGGLLMFGAAQHLLAKTLSFAVGVVLAIAAVIALISGNVLGLAAANIWTEVGWGGCAAILLLNSAVPRRTRNVTGPAVELAAVEPGDPLAPMAPAQPVAVTQPAAGVQSGTVAQPVGGGQPVPVARRPVTAPPADATAPVVRDRGDRDVVPQPVGTHQSGQ